MRAIIISVFIFLVNVNNVFCQTDSVSIFTEWIKTSAKPITHLKAENGFADLQHLKQTLKNVQIVGLGEATHGTKEFFQTKHRLLEFLVKEMDFKVFGLEASQSRCQYINQFVNEGIGNLDTAVVMQGFPTWQTEEVRDLIKWMKKYNSSVSSDKKVQFVGFDIQVNDWSVKRILEFIKKVDKAKKPQLASLFSHFQKVEDNSGALGGDTTIRQLIKPFNDLMVSFLENKGKYTLLSSENEFNEVLRYLKLVNQYTSVYSDTKYWSGNLEFKGRDYYMAENIFEWYNHFKKPKMVLWAHNDHVLKSDYSASIGNYVRGLFQDKYYAIGFDFYQGHFNANNIELKDSPGWEDNYIGPCDANSFANYFEKAGCQNTFLDFRFRKKQPVIESWLKNKDFGLYSIGAWFEPSKKASENVQFINLLDSFDAMIFIKNSSRAIPVKNLNIDFYSK